MSRSRVGWLCLLVSGRELAEFKVMSGWQNDLTVVASGSELQREHLAAYSPAAFLPMVFIKLL